MISIETTDTRLIMFNLKDYESELSFLAILEVACKQNQKKIFNIREDARTFEVKSENVSAYYFEKRRYIHSDGEAIENLIASIEKEGHGK